MTTTTGSGAPHGVPMVAPCPGMRLSPDVEAAAERAVPGVQIVASSMELMLTSGRRPNNEGMFWRAWLARHAVILVAARRCSGHLPTREVLQALGLGDAAAETTDGALAAVAARLGLPG